MFFPQSTTHTPIPLTPSWIGSPLTLLPPHLGWQRLSARLDLLGQLGPAQAVDGEVIGVTLGLRREGGGGKTVRGGEVVDGEVIRVTLGLRREEGGGGEGKAVRGGEVVDGEIIGISNGLRREGVGKASGGPKWQAVAAGRGLFHVILAPTPSHHLPTHLQLSCRHLLRCDKDAVIVHHAVGHTQQDSVHLTGLAGLRGGKEAERKGRDRGEERGGDRGEGNQRLLSRGAM